MRKFVVNFILAIALMAGFSVTPAKADEVVYLLNSDDVQSGIQSSLPGKGDGPDEIYSTAVASVLCVVPDEHPVDLTVVFNFGITAKGGAAGEVKTAYVYEFDESSGNRWWIGQAQVSNGQAFFGTIVTPGWHHWIIDVYIQGSMENDAVLNTGCGGGFAYDTVDGSQMNTYVGYADTTMYYRANIQRPVINITDYRTEVPAGANQYCVYKLQYAYNARTIGSVLQFVPQKDGTNQLQTVESWCQTYSEVSNDGGKGWNNVFWFNSQLEIGHYAIQLQVIQNGQYAAGLMVEFDVVERFSMNQLQSPFVHPGDNITVTGTSFRPQMGLDLAAFGGGAVTSIGYTYINDRTLSFTVPNDIPDGYYMIESFNNLGWGRIFMWVKSGGAVQFLQGSGTVLANIVEWVDGTIHTEFTEASKKYIWKGAVTQKGGKGKINFNFKLKK